MYSFIKKTLFPNRFNDSRMAIIEKHFNFAHSFDHFQKIMLMQFIGIVIACHLLK